ncbi:MAG TPA: sensor domain-containing diguanylate cyclase [Candidatus Acidoferrales bacterium]|nr:sensor domain-containing diguanylate cyclase [Candidatus Acidoferrales bacterium]
MKEVRPAGGGTPSDRATAAVVHYFMADPLRSARAERIASDLGMPVSTVQQILDRLVVIGVLDRRNAEVAQAPVYVSRIADQFLDVIERLTNFFNQQLEDITVSPERAQLATGETPALMDRDGVHALRARLASVEAANALLQRKNLELSFLYEASLLLASSIDLSTLGQTVVSAVVNASRFKIRRCFVALADGDAFLYHAGHGIDPLDAEQFMFRYRARLRQCLERGEVVASRAETLEDETGGEAAMCVIIPMRSHSPDRGYGCIVITEMEEGGLTGDDLRTLTQLAELAGRSLANASLYSRSVELGMTDALTGVLNRRYLDRRLADEVKRAQRGGGQLAVLIVDLDLFKSVNDRFGHLEGDRLLQAIARTIGASVRDIDVVTRFGGEEFAVILPGASEGDAYAVAERIRRAIEVMDYTSMAHGYIPITLSGGIAALDSTIHTAAQLIGVADRRLLEAKRTGRNKTVSGEKYLVSGM